jgi:hypothetical protein
MMNWSTNQHILGSSTILMHARILAEFVAEFIQHPIHPFYWEVFHCGHPFKSSETRTI